MQFQVVIFIYRFQSLKRIQRYKSIQYIISKLIGMVTLRMLIIRTVTLCTTALISVINSGIQPFIFAGCNWLQKQRSGNPTSTPHGGNLHSQTLTPQSEMQSSSHTSSCVARSQSSHTSGTQMGNMSFDLNLLIYKVISRNTQFKQRIWKIEWVSFLYSHHIQYKVERSCHNVVKTMLLLLLLTLVPCLNCRRFFL